jgi:hypothetical protein
MADDADRSDKLLGRGLEDISYLFLSQPTNEFDTREPGWSRPSANMGERPASSGSHGGTVLLKREQIGSDKSRLIALLRGCDTALEESLHAIDANVPCDPYGEIDLMAIDQASQLTIIDAETVADDRLLLRGLGHVDWTTRNVALLRRMYRGHAINFSLRPRLVLVAPQFSQLIQSVAHQITHSQVGCVRYHSVELAAGSGLMFERLCFVST